MSKNTQKAKQPAEKAATKAKLPPKWGTLGWIAAYPHSRMDRKRRARAEKAVGAETMERLCKGPHLCCLLDRISEVMDAYPGMSFSGPVKKDVERALRTVGNFENAVYDCAFAMELARAWKLDASELELDYKGGAVNRPARQAAAPVRRKEA